MYRTILVPVDGSDTADRGLREAIRLAKSEGSRLRILHVVVDYTRFETFEGAVYTPDLLTILREDGKKILARAAQFAERGGVAAKTLLVERLGSLPADVIVEQAAKLRADLIVIGTHGRRGIRRLVLGSDAEQVLRSTPVPVLLVRARPQAAVARRKAAPRTSRRRG